MQKIIRIKAECDNFSIDEQKSEKKAESRLRQIKKMFEKHGQGKLKVTISVINPSLI